MTTQDKALYKVTDDDTGNGDVYGEAASKADAIRVADAVFADRVVDAYLATDVTLRDGTVLPVAWVALTFKMPNRWSEYDSAAEWCARRSIAGNYGDPLPPLISVEARALIDADPEAFAERVKATAYALAMEATINGRGE